MVQLFHWAKFGLIYCFLKWQQQEQKMSLLKTHCFNKGKDCRTSILGWTYTCYLSEHPFSLSQCYDPQRSVCTSLRCWFPSFLPTGLLEATANDEFVKFLCRSRVCKCLAHGSLIAIFLVKLHLWSAVQGEEQS